MEFKVKTKLLKTIQTLVMRYDGRIILPSLNGRDNSFIGVRFFKVENGNKFNVMRNIIQQPFFLG
jgi:hypothetical protein